MDISELKAVHEGYKNYEAEWDWADALRRNALRTASERKPWLPRAKNEPTDLYDVRCELSAHAPLLPLIAARVAGAVFAKPPRRAGVPEGGKLEAFADNATRDGASLSDLTRRAVMGACWQRWHLALLDRPADADEAVKRETPYVVLFGPKDVLDWRIGVRGTLEYVKLRSPSYRRGGATVTEYREVTLEGIQVWRLVNIAGKEQVENGGHAPLAPGLVEAEALPVAICKVGYDDAMESEGVFSGALNAELRHYRLESDLNFDVYIHAHPVLKAWMRTLGDDAPAPVVALGSTVCHHLNPGRGADEPQENLEYLEPPSVAFDSQRAERDQAAADIFGQVGATPKAAPASPDGQVDVASGVKTAWDFEVSESPVLRTIARMADDFEYAVLRLVALELGEEPDDELRSTYSKDFALKSPEAMVLRAEAATRVFGYESTLVRELKKRAAAALLDNASPDMLADIEKEIDSATEPEPPDGFGTQEGDEED